ncbi:MAG: DNA polymerase/3'-5' exonuclease PolX [Nitrospiraceae bacterium]|nr:DNA polymerase/3'-5' exonuclease PolX [Nitrospiraceae bacterium]
MKNAEIAKIFYDMADILEINDENPFRVRAYRRAALNIEGHPKDAALLPVEELRKIPGIGADLAGKIREITETGTCADYEKLKKKYPAGLTEILAIPGLGPKTAKFLNDKFKVKGIDHLEMLAREHKLKGPGIKEKTEMNIIKGIEMLRGRQTERHPIGKVLPSARELMEYLGKSSAVRKISIAGSLRRWKETVRDIDILAASARPDELMDYFVKLPQVSRVLAKGPTKSSVVIGYGGNGIQADLRVVEEDAYGAALCYFTGSKEHNIRLREMAVKRGLKVNEYGIFDSKGKKIGGQREEDVYQAVGLPYIPPELREDSGEIEAALKGQLPSLIQLSDIKGDLHAHSKQSDGSYPLEKLIEAARARGYNYMALTDHSKSLGIARGLDEQKILEQIKMIDALNKKLRGFRVLKGVELDIRGDGALDLPDAILARLEIVNASIHSGFRQDAARITGRIVRAMENPYVNVISHPTGRLIGEREAYGLDFERVLKAAKETGTALEINCYPARLDLNDQMARRARDMGIPLVISTDTHVLTHFEFMEYGVEVARRAWCGPGDVLNTLDLKNLLAALAAKRKKLAAV